jgi:hypothetical protein
MNLVANNTSEPFGFIVTRHVTNSETAKYWIECYRCIRIHYPDAPIVFIDDNSDPEFIDKVCEDALYKCTVIRSIFHKRGELLPYYYYLLNNWFETAIVIHDSVFVNAYVDYKTLLTDQNECIFLWHFERENLYYNKLNEERVINKLKNGHHVILLYKQWQRWKGCFGAMSLISRNFLLEMEKQYEFSKLISHITSRDDRMAIERVFACMVFDLKYKKTNISNGTGSIHVVSVYGDIYKYCECRYSYSYSDYINKIDDSNHKLPLIKVWTGR